MKKNVGIECIYIYDFFSLDRNICRNIDKNVFIYAVINNILKYQKKTCLIEIMSVQLDKII